MDWRNITTGSVIPTKTYSDQPYVVKTDDGAWLCTVTTGSGEEGRPGQHIVCMRSTDQGKTWSEAVALEPADGPEASYSVLLRTPTGRIYCFYNHNTDNLRAVKADDPPFPGGYCERVDSQGYFVFKFSDDNGLSWSDKRYSIPIREMDIDRKNPYGGKIQFFWNVGKPFSFGGDAFVSLHKVGGFGEGFFTRSEGVLLKSGNLLSERDPEKITWETLPDGDFGLRTPPGGGPISEEQSYCVLSDGSFYCVYRTVDGHPTCCYSRDGGHTWSTPQYKRFADGRRMGHPRAANFVWKCQNGKYLYWFHNHRGNWYDDRNPVWVSGGVEADGPEGRIIRWSQPEILLYDDDTFVRISYPDLVEEDGKYFITETQKNLARVHQIPPEFLNNLWQQLENNRAVDTDILAEYAEKEGATVTMPALPELLQRDGSRADYGTLDTRSGFTIDAWVKLSSASGNSILLDSRASDGSGTAIIVSTDGSFELILSDGRTENRWRSDSAPIFDGKLHHVAAVVDGGPKLIYFLIDGKLCDGGGKRQFGWGRYSPQLRHSNGVKKAQAGHAEALLVRKLRIYSRALTISELVGNYQAGI